MQLQTPIHSTKRFSFSRETGFFVAEASDFRGQHVDGPLFDDSCDLGLALRSHVTGKEIVFALHGEDRDAHGEVTGWRYVPLHARDTACGVQGVLIIND